jgi:hypothetical protein
MLFFSLIEYWTKLEYSWRILIKIPNLKIHENLLGGSQVVPCGQMCGWMVGDTEMTKLTNIYYSKTVSKRNNFLGIRILFDVQGFCVTWDAGEVYGTLNLAYLGITFLMRHCWLKYMFAQHFVILVLMFLYRLMEYAWPAITCLTHRIIFLFQENCCVYRRF